MPTTPSPPSENAQLNSLVEDIRRVCDHAERHLASGFANQNDSADDWKQLARVRAWLAGPGDVT